MSRKVLVALTQTCNVWPHMPERLEGLDGVASRLAEIREANVVHHLGLMAKAAAQGAHIIGFGELFPAPFFALSRHPMWLSLAEDARTGPTVSALREAARAHKLVVVAPLPELDGRTGKRFNAAVVIDRTGEVLGVYRKVHLPQGANEKGSFDEPFYFSVSDGQMQNDPAFNASSNPYFPVFQTSLGKVGVAICYDRHFEGVIKSLAQEGAELIFSPAVTFGAKSERMWELEFPVDACRHGVFIAGSNRAGSEKPWNQPFFGKSYVVGPNGRAANISADPELILSEVDLSECSSPDPSGWNLKRDLRPGCYSP